MINQTQEEFYRKEFLPLYNSKKFGEAEEIARKKNLGMLLDEKQMTMMVFMVAHKNKDQLQTALYYEDIDLSINSYEESINRGNYWIKIVEARK
jgi:hypothetical protein